MISWPAAVLPKFQDGTAGFELTPDEQSWMVSILFVGAVLSPIPASYVMDIIGRKNILLCATVMGIVVWIILLISTNVIPIYIARVLCGVFCGVEYTTVANFMAETVDPKIRGRAGTLLTIMFGLGALFISLISFCSYTTITLICLAFTVILMVCFLFLPETPYFYLMKGKRKEAENSVKWFRGSCSPEDLNRVEEAINEQLKKSGTYLDLFRNPVVFKAFIMVEVMKFVSASSCSVFLMAYAPLVIPPSWITVQQSYIVFCVALVLTALGISIYMDKFNRRSMMLVSCGGAVIVLAADTIWYYLRDKTTVDVTQTAWLPLVLIVITGAFESIGLVSIPGIYKGEVFPINLKCKASALSCVTACFFEGVNNYVFFPINENIGMYFNFVKSLVTAIIGIVFTLFFMVETRGKTLEEIQDILNKNNTAEGRFGAPPGKVKRLE